MAIGNREQRIATAALLLGILRQLGGSGKLAAKYLRVSTTTISHWEAVDSLEGRSVGAPTDSHLAKLIVVVHYQIKQNLKAIDMFLQKDECIRWSEQFSLLKAIAPEVEERVKSWREKLSKDEKFVDELKALSEKHGTNVLSNVMQPDESTETANYTQPEPESVEIAFRVENGKIVDGLSPFEILTELDGERSRFVENVYNRAKQMLQKD